MMPVARNSYYIHLMLACVAFTAAVAVRTLPNLASFDARLRSKSSLDCRTSLSWRFFPDSFDKKFGEMRTCGAALR